MKPGLFSAFAFLALATELASSARGDTVLGSFTGAPFSNTGLVTMSAEVDLNNFAFDLGPQGAYAHSWWYSPGGFTSLSAVVSGSTTPEFNGTFEADAFNWLRIYSNSATPQEALTDGNSFADLGASYAVDFAPSDAGIGLLQLGAVSSAGGPPPGEYVASLAITNAIPEPGSVILFGAGCLFVISYPRRWK